MTTPVSQDQWWPFGSDADRNDPLTELRIPVTGAYPGFCYLLAFHRASAQRPTEHEVQLLQAMRRYLIEFSVDRRQRAVLGDRALDVELGFDTFVFHKWGAGDWGYRQRSWVVDVTFGPPHPSYRERYLKPDAARACTLAQLLDRINTAGGMLIGHWATWKADHPDVFCEAVTSHG